MSTAPLVSERRLAANRANALLSTGPTTPEGKAKSSLNAVKSGLTGRAVLLPSEDVSAYETHIARFQKDLQPVGDQEIHLVQSLADTQWRLDRIPNLETGLFALGRMRYADLFADETDEHIRRTLLDAHIWMTDAKHFKNLHLQEARLRRQYQQDLQELRKLQAQRQQEQPEVTADSEPSRDRRKSNLPLTARGFEFTNAEKHSRKEQPLTDRQPSDSALFRTTSV